MDRNVYEQVLCAVDVCHSSTSSQNERHAAYAYCEEFQKRHDCIQYAFYLLQDSTRSSQHRHFALHVIETWIRQHWKACSPDEAVNYRVTLLTIMASHLQQDEPTFLKEKLVKVVADIAKRSFPQRWPDMLQHLTQVWSISSLHAELVMLIFRSIAEDCVSSSFNSTIPPARRKDILQGLNALFPTLFPYVYRELEQQYVRLQQQDTRAASVILAGLQMLKEFLDWMPVTTAASPETNFIAVASLLVQSATAPLSLRIAAAECLEEFFSRSFAKENLMLLKDTSIVCWSSLSTISVAGPVNDADTLLLHQHINRILVSWGTHQVDLLVPELPSTLPVFQPYFSLLQALFAHSSLHITEAQVIVWLNLLKVTPLQPYIDYPALWQSCLDKYFKLTSPDRDDAPATVLLEFDDQDAYNAFYGNFRGRLYGILRLLVQKQPPVALQHLYDRLHYVLTQQSAGTDNLDDLGHCTDVTTAHLFHEGMASLTDCLVKSLPDSVYDNAQLLQKLGQSVELLLAYTTLDPWLLFRHCLALASFSKYYMRVPATYPRVFDRLFGLIVFCEPGESIMTSMRPTSTNVRRRALASLISICHAGPVHVLPYLPILCVQVVNLFPQVLDSESVLMYEMLVVVSNSMPTLEERVAFIQELTARPLTEWTSGEMTQVVSSPDNLVKALDQGTVLFAILKTLTTLYGIAKRIEIKDDENQQPTKHPFASSWPLLLPNLTALLATLQALSNPAMRQAVLESNARGLLCMSHEEINQALLGKEVVEVTAPAVMKAARWAKNVRDICFHLLGCALSHANVYTSLDVAGLLNASVLANLSWLEHRHWKSFLSSVWLPFVKSCPPTLYSSLLEPTVRLILTHLHERIVVSNSAPLYQPHFDGVDIQATTVDTICHALFLEVVRHTVDFIEALVDAKTVVDMESDHPKHIVVESDRLLRDFVLSSDVLTGLVVRLLVAILGWTDTLSARRATTLLDRLVSILFTQRQHFELFGKDVFAAALGTLLQHFHDVDDGLKWEVINLLRNIYCRLTLGLLPVDECKGIDPLNQPLKSDHELCLVPRSILAGLHGVEPAQVVEFEANLRAHPSAKTQKNYLKEFVETPFLAYVQAPHTFKAIEDLPESLVIRQPGGNKPNPPVIVDASALFAGQ
ncbi:hypothetical protein AC1031_003375 [Aphanomyces cochlioides]|nr:hypothetical protein AC1031_003375 [Aphanomyces cochlioides]